MNNSIICYLQNVGVKEMNAGNSPIIGVMEVYDLPGIYTVTIPCPKSRSTAVVRLEMKDKNKILFVDEFSLSFHMHWYKLMKVRRNFSLALINPEVSSFK